MAPTRAVSRPEDFWSLVDFDRCAGTGLELDLQPSAVCAVPELAQQYGLNSLTIKRDDLLPALHGGTKIRTLNYLLNQPEYSSAKEWHAFGSIGSGNLVAAAKLAAHQKKRLHAHCFWVPLTPGILDNLAQLTAEHVTLSYYSGRVALFLRYPGLFMGMTRRTVIPAGSTCARGMIGIARAGVELAEQIKAGLCPSPSHIYVPFGSGGTAAGLAVGLALGGIDTSVCAVSVVEPWFSMQLRIRYLITQCATYLKSLGIENNSRPSAVPIEIKRGFVGPGYSKSTAKSRNACDVAKSYGYSLEEVYSGKTFAALLDHASTHGQSCLSQDELFWLTPHDKQRLEPMANWHERLPPRLRQRLEEQNSKGMTRRRWFQVSGALVVTGTLWYRTSAYLPLTNWRGKILAQWEVRVLQAAIDAVAPSRLSKDLRQTIVDEAPEKIDAFLLGMPEWFINEVHALFAFIEHGTVLDFRLNRFTRLSLSGRRATLKRLHGYGGLSADSYRGIRNLCLMAIYHHQASWRSLHYEGPRLASMKGPTRMIWPDYEALKAPTGAVPQ